MEWSSDLVRRTGGGTRFDSRLAQVTFLGHVGKAFSWIFTHVGAGWGTLLRGVGVTFWSGRGHFFMIFRMSWEVSGSGFGMLLDRFREVLNKNVRRGPKIRIFKIDREYLS